MAPIEVLSVEPQRHFGEDPGEVVQEWFFFERSNGHPEQLTALLESVVDLPGMGLDWKNGCVPLWECSKSASSLSLKIIYNEYTSN